MQRAATIPPTIFETFPRAVTRASSISNIYSSNKTPHSRLFQSRPPAMASPNYDEYKIENRDIPTAAGVTIDDNQKVIVGSVLDLFGGRPSLRKLSLWTDDATFLDPLTIAEGRKQYAAQWYGLRAAFSKIERLGGQVNSAGNPIEMDLKNRYVVKGINSEQTVDSKVKIFTEGNGAGMRIKKVEDRWGDSLPDGIFTNAMRNLNSVVVPTVVKVPKSIEEEEAAAAPTAGS